MLTVQQMLDIAARHFTAMADAMVAACVAKAIEEGLPLVVPERPSGKRTRGGAPARPAPSGERVEWRRLVERNSDTRWQHV